jgi:hypothetical protein
MAKLSNETAEIFWLLKRQLLDIIDEATAAEFLLFERFGETDRTMSYLDELKSVSEQATARFARFSSIQLRLADAQPAVPVDMLELATEIISSTQQRLPALNRSIQEIKGEWRLT